MPKGIGADISVLDSLPKNSEMAAEAIKPAPKAQEAAAAESLEELMQKFAESDGSGDDQALTDKIIKQVEASDREEAKSKEAKAKPQQSPQPPSSLS